MPGDYSMSIKNARLAVVRDELSGGSIEILSDAGARLASFELEKKSGDVISGSLVFDGFPKMAMAERKGRASAARLVSAAGDVVRYGMTVGVEAPATADMPAQKFDIALVNVEIAAENVVRIDRAEIRS